jgi:hypothetical protein
MADISTTPSYDYLTSPESSSPLSSQALPRNRGISNQEVHLALVPPEIPRRNPQRLQRREPRMDNLTPTGEYGSHRVDSSTSEVAVHLRETRPPQLRATEQKAHEPEVIPQITVSSPRGFETCLQPPGHVSQAPRARSAADEEARRLSEKSVFRNIYKTRDRGNSEARSPPTARSPQQEQVMFHPRIPIPERSSRRNNEPLRMRARPS